MPGEEIITENGLFSMIDSLKAFPQTWRWLPNLLVASTATFSPGCAAGAGMCSAATDSL